MSLFLEASPDTFVPWSGEAINGIRYPRDIAQKWSAEDLKAIGLYKPEPADPIPAGKISAGQSVQRVDGVVKWVHTLEDAPEPTVDERKAQMTAAINAKRDQILTGGYTVTSGTLEGKVLQTRNLEDRTNWLTSQAAYSAAVAAGQGSVEGAEFRTEDNQTITLTFSEGLSVLLAMAAWGASVMKRSWDLKDAVAAAEAHEDLDAIDIEADWPS